MRPGGELIKRRGHSPSLPSSIASSVPPTHEGHDSLSPRSERARQQRPLARLWKDSMMKMQDRENLQR